MYRSNNFDLIRLLAALQVFIGHTRGYLGLQFPQPILDAIKYFPGVVAFFVISGFLIFGSFDRNPDLIQYYKNRLLRIFPAMWVAFFVTAGLIYAAGFTAGSHYETFKWIAWQLTIYPMYSTPGVEAYANNHPNPSLWTITIEISFYIFVPILFWLARKKINMTRMILILIIASCIFNYVMLVFRTNKIPFFYDTWDKNLFPYLFYFLLGAVSYLHFDKLKRLYIGKGLYWLAGYLLYVGIVAIYFNLYEVSYYVNIFGMIGAVIYAQTVISLAFTMPDLSHKLLRGVDISYGVYLYQMIIIHVFNRYGYNGNNATFFPVLLLTTIAGFLSWFLVEKPALKLKKRFPRIKTSLQTR